MLYCHKQSYKADFFFNIGMERAITYISSFYN